MLCHLRIAPNGRRLGVWVGECKSSDGRKTFCERTPRRHNRLLTVRCLGLFQSFHFVIIKQRFHLSNSNFIQLH